MSLIQGNTKVSAGGYNIDQSIRFNSADSAYLSRTPSSNPTGGDASGAKKFTVSCWLKRGKLSTAQSVIAANTSVSSVMAIQLAGTSGSTLADQIDFDQQSGGSSRDRMIPAALHRDVSAWYHLCAMVDTTQATAADRVKIAINGVLVSTWYTNDPPAVDAYLQWNKNGVLQRIGSNSYSVGNLFDGYIAEFHNVDGVAAETDFGEYDTSGVWIPKAYTGSYGTNGFYITGADSSDLGADYSGNSNDLTSSGLTSADQVADTPTNNHTTWNPLANQRSAGTFTEGLTTYAYTSTTRTLCTTTMLPDSGKYCMAVVASATTAQDYEFGLLRVDDSNLGDAVGSNEDGNATLFPSTTYWLTQKGVGSVDTSVAVDAADELWCAVDYDAGKMWHGIYDDSAASMLWFDVLGASTGDPGAGTGPCATTNVTATTVGLHIFGGLSRDSVSLTIKRSGEVSGTVPTGFTYLDGSSDLPAPAITDGTAHFQTTLYTGDGNQTQTITQSENSTFNPDFIWIKNRSNAYSHNLNDAVRGYTGASPSTAADVKVLASNNKDQEGLDSVTTAIQRGFVQESTADGFIVNKGTTGSQDGYYTNANAHTYAAWQWLAGNGTATNEDGSITSTVSANVDAGFSVIGYTGNATSGATIGHGLGVAPSVVITKSRSSSSYHWYVYHPSNGATKYMRLNDNSAVYTDSAAWNDTAPTSSVITLGNSSATNNAGTMIAYAFAEVAGYSKFGSYTGNGSADGSVVNLGFAPAFVMVKRTDAADNWAMYDAAREPYNVAEKYLYADTTAAEATYSTAKIDFLSNGFKWRGSVNFGNRSGGTYIYVAFAENPFGGDGVAPATAR